MSVKSKALSGAKNLHQVHENDGDGGSHGLGAQHELTRLPDPEDISGDRRGKAHPTGGHGSAFNMGAHKGDLLDNRPERANVPGTPEIPAEFLDQE
jgi:hypothetical protein